jgi:hypothetical protein
VVVLIDWTGTSAIELSDDKVEAFKVALAKEVIADEELEEFAYLKDDEVIGPLLEMKVSITQ